VASKAFVFNDPDEQFISSTEFVELSRLPLEPGSYVVLAKGDFGGSLLKMEFRLDVKGSIDESHADAGTAGTSVEGGFGFATFMLVVGATIPPKGVGGSGRVPDLNHRATLFARKFSGPGHGTVRNVKIVAIPFDELAVTP
jgi:hypothetical protein